MERVEQSGFPELFEKLWFAIKYVVTFENPLVSVLVIIFLGLNALHLYKIKTSTKYADKASKDREVKVFGIIPISYPDLKDTLVFFALAAGLFGTIMVVFIHP